MRVTGKFEILKQVWPAAVSHSQPKLYVCDNQNRVTSVFPIPGSNYEWSLEDLPSEGDFLAHYGYPHRVTAVQQ